MAASPGRGVRIWGELWRIRVLHELHYRANFAMNLLQVAVDVAVGIVAIRLVVANVESLNGWSEAELVVVLGTYTMLEAVLRSLMWPNLEAIVRDVRDGTFDGVLVLPADDQLVVSTRELSMWDLTGVLVGAGIVVVGARGLDGVDLGAVASFLVLLGVGVVIVYSFFFAMVSLSFRLVDVEDLMFRFFQGGQASGRWPIGMFPGWLRVALTAIVPIGVAVTIPATVLTGRLSVAGFALALAAGGAAFLTSRWIFRAGLRHYSGASA